MALLRGMQTGWPLRGRGAQARHEHRSIGGAGGDLFGSNAVQPRPDQAHTTNAQAATRPARYTGRRSMRFLRGLGAALRDLGTARAGIVSLPGLDDER